MKNNVLKILGVLILACFIAITLTSCTTENDKGNYTRIVSDNHSKRELIDKPGSEELEVKTEVIDFTMSAADVVEAFFSGIYQNMIDDALCFLDENSVMFSLTSLDVLGRAFSDIISNADFVYLDTEVQSSDNINGYEGFSVIVNILQDGTKHTIDEGIIYTIRRDDGYKVLYGGFLYFDVSIYDQQALQNLYQAQEQARLFQEMSLIAQDQAIRDAQQMQDQAIRDALFAQEQANQTAQHAQQMQDQAIRDALFAQEQANQTAQHAQQMQDQAIRDAQFAQEQANQAAQQAQQAYNQMFFP